MIIDFITGRRADDYMLDFGYYNMDRMDGMKEFPNNYFDLAIVDPIYGDVRAGGYMTGKSKGGVGPHPDYNYSIEVKIALAGSFGINAMEIQIGQIVSWHGLRLIQQ